MHFSHLHFKNIDDSLKSKIYQKTAQIFDHLENYNASGTFGRRTSGEYFATINAYSNLGEVHAKTEDENLHQVIFNLKKKVRSQVSKEKGRLLAHRHDFQSRMESSSPVGYQGDTSAAYKLEMAERPRVLIIDDDIEAIIPIEMIFRSQGCLTNFAIEREEAIRKLMTNSADIVVLDWMFDRITGGQLLREALSQGLNDVPLEGATVSKVITYSGLGSEHIHFPDNGHFQHIQHWQKPIDYEQIEENLKNLIAAV